MYLSTSRQDWPSPSDLFDGPVVDEDLEEPTYPEDEEMAPVDPATVEQPTERHVAFVKRLYRLAA